MRKDVRAITAFPKGGDDLVHKYEFEDSLVDYLRPLFEIGDDYDMVLVYPIDDNVKGEVARITGIPMNEDLDYFLEAYYVETDE